MIDNISIAAFSGAVNLLIIQYWKNNMWSILTFIFGLSSLEKSMQSDNKYSVKYTSLPKFSALIMHFCNKEKFQMDII